MAELLFDGHTGLYTTGNKPLTSHRVEFPVLMSIGEREHDHKLPSEGRSDRKRIIYPLKEHYHTIAEFLTRDDIGTIFI